MMFNVKHLTSLNRRMEWATRLMARLYHLGTLLCEEFAQLGAMAMGFVFTVAADGEIGVMGESGEEFDGVAVFGRGHFGAVLLDEFGPLSRSVGGEGEFHDRKARGEVRKPDVLPVLGSEFRFGDTAWRTTHGADTQTFVF